MKSVSIVGIGSTPFGVLEGLSLKSLAVTAGNLAIEESGVNRKEISALYVVSERKVGLKFLRIPPHDEK